MMYINCINIGAMDKNYNTKTRTHKKNCLNARRTRFKKHATIGDHIKHLCRHMSISIIPSFYNTLGKPFVSIISLATVSAPRQVLYSDPGNDRSLAKPLPIAAAV